MTMRTRCRSSASATPRRGERRSRGSTEKARRRRLFPSATRSSRSCSGTRCLGTARTIRRCAATLCLCLRSGRRVHVHLLPVVLTYLPPPSTPTSLARTYTVQIVMLCCVPPNGALEPCTRRALKFAMKCGTISIGVSAEQRLRNQAKVASLRDVDERVTVSLRYVPLLHLVIVRSLLTF